MIPIKKKPDNHRPLTFKKYFEIVNFYYWLSYNIILLVINLSNDYKLLLPILY